MILRRLRGILGTAFLWSVSWVVLLGLGLTLTVLILRVRVPLFRALAEGLTAGFSWGLAAGALFGSALMLAEQRRGIASLTPTRGAIWGTLAGIWFPSLISLRFGSEALPWLTGAWPAWVATAAMGAASGAASVWLSARAGADLPPAPPTAGILPGQAMASGGDLSLATPLQPGIARPARGE